MIPRTFSPAPLEEIPVEDLNIDEFQELTRRQKAQAEATSMGINKEQAEANLRTLRAVKRTQEDTMSDSECDEVEAFATDSVHKRQRTEDEQEVIELSS